jgi:hypothetical protein
VEQPDTSKPGCIRVLTSPKATRSRKAMVTRDRHQARGWPVNIRLAGVTLGLTVAAARDLAEQLQAVTAPGAPRITIATGSQP